MTNTTNYDLILVEGSDKVNPLTQVNPNFEVIDAEMKKNKDAGVSTATELLTGSIHGLQRVNADASMFRFTATSNYTAGDTFTVDGIQVTALTPTGEALGDGAYIIGSEVLCCLKGTLLTMFLSGGTVTTADNALKLGGEDPEYYGKATDVAQAQSTASAAGVLANSVQTQVTELKEDLGFDELWSNVEASSITTGTTIAIPNLSDYKTLRFVGDSVPGAWSATFSEDVGTQIWAPGVQQSITPVLVGKSPYQGANEFAWRGVTINFATNQIIFGQGYVTGAASNAAMMVRKIYGQKY
ncbi:MAG: hypothetical protein KBT06_01190 [Prevotellaceae bacterium]|nr:hypothetical protein [Candidatus Colivivens equi]